MSREYMIRYFAKDGSVDGAPEVCGSREEAEALAPWLMRSMWWAVRWEIYEIEGVGSE